ncbi:MAG: kinase [Rheinheimera sp.]|nr:kinase [Rheinheimera sp.]
MTTGDALMNASLVSACAQQVRQNGLKIFAISGAQGSGKTTLAASLQQALQQDRLRCGVVSLDDYYLSRRDRQILERQIHPLFAMRGVPGTHQIQRFQQDLQLQQQGKALALPRFDKGRDDSSADLPATCYDVLIVEGWCLGAMAQSAEQLASPVNVLDLEPDAAIWRGYQNQQLQECYQPLWPLLQQMIYLQAPDWPTVCHWRQQQEDALWRQQGTGMGPVALQQFMLPFQRWTAAMLGGLIYSGVQRVQLNDFRQVDSR